MSHRLGLSPSWHAAPAIRSRWRGIATLNELAKPGVYEGVNALQKNWFTACGRSRGAGIVAQVNASVHFPPSSSRLIRSPITPGQALRHEALRRLLPQMLDRGIFLAPSQFEAAFVPLPHFRRYDRTIATAQKYKIIAAQPSA